MPSRLYKQVDVFTDQPYLGNPLAVVLDGSGLSDEAMQQFAAWTHLSETTFLLPPSDAGRQGGADYRVRIFTPGGELPFAGHPTLGSCHAWLEAGGQPRQADRVVQECAVGLVTLQRQDRRWAFAAPPLQRSAPPPAQLAQVASALGLKPAQVLAAQRLDNGPVWLGLLVDSAQTVLALEPDHILLKNLGQKVGVVGIDTHDSATALIARSSQEAQAFGARAPTVPPQVEVRAFAAPMGINEDPVTGSLNASLAQWLIADGHLPPAYVASQGSCLQRAGQVHIRQDAQQQVWVGGDAVTCIDGRVRL